MTSINTWIDPESHILRCDRTVRTDAPAAATVILSLIGSAVLGPVAYCGPASNQQRLVEVHFLKDSHD